MAMTGTTAPDEPDGSRTPLPFLLPSSDDGRDTVEAWREWRRSRHLFLPAPHLTLDQYRALSPREKRLHNLHRASTHANLAVQETPMSARVVRLLEMRVQSGALKRRPGARAGVMVNGGGYQGKTETVCEFAAAFEDLWLDLHRGFNPASLPGTRDLHAPVAYVPTPVKATPKSTCQAILDFYGGPTDMTLPQLLRAVRSSIADHGTKVLIMDDITRLKLHRQDDQDVLDMIRDLMNMQVTLVLIGVGIRRSGLLREGRFDADTNQWVCLPPQHKPKSYNDEAATQTERRFDVIDLDPFRYDTPEQITAWVTHLHGIEEQLRLFRSSPGMLVDGTMPEYLFRRTGGIVGLLERLIEDGCQMAIADGSERLTEDLFDQIKINVGNLPNDNHDAESGEVPDVPPHTPKKRRRGRNTVFDDHGLPQKDAG